MRIIVTVPENTKPDYFEKICIGFKEKYGNDVSFVRETHPDLIGGFVAEVDGIVYDTSIRSKLAEIKKVFTEKKR